MALASWRGPILLMWWTYEDCFRNLPRGSDVR